MRPACFPSRIHLQACPDARVAYGSLLLERRRGLHARLVEAIEALAPDRGTGGRFAAAQTRSNAWRIMPCAASCGTKLCSTASRPAPGPSTAPHSARRWPPRASLQALTHLPEDNDTRVLAIDLRRALGGALLPLGEYGRHCALLGEAEALARALDDRARLGQVLASMALVLVITGDPDGAMAASRQALDLAVALGDSALQMQASHTLGQAYYAIGDFGRAAELRRNVEAADRQSGTPRTDVRIYPRRPWRGPWARLGYSPRAGATRRRHCALPRWKVEEPHRSLSTASSSRLYLAQGDLEHAIRVYDQGLPLVRASGSRNCCP